MNNGTKSGQVNAYELITLSRNSISSRIKSELVALSNQDVATIPKIVVTIINIIKQKLSIGTSVRMRNVGCLSIRYKSERTGARNPKTGEPAIVSARKTVTIRKGRNNRGYYEFGWSALIDHLLREHTLVSKKSMRAIVKSFLETVGAVSNGDVRIELRGLGTFYPSYIKEGVRRNPKTGGTVLSEAYFAIRFKMAKSIKDSLNNTRSPAL
jgi:integration host factor subunit beta